MIASEADKFHGYCNFVEWVHKVYKDPKINFGYENFVKLPDLDIDLIILHFCYNISYREIGNIYNMSGSNVDRRIHYSFRRLNRGDFN